MKIFVCIKQVPGITEVRIDPKTNTLIRQGIPSIMNPDDKHGVQLAVSLKEEHGAEVIALSMGPPQAEEVLREAMSMGADKGILLTDRAFAGADTLATSHTLAIAIKKVVEESKEKEYLIICGTQAIDGDTAQVGPEIAEELGIPQITMVQKFEIKGKKIIVERVFRAEEVVVIETSLPALISVMKEINEPKYPTMMGIVGAFEEKEVIKWTAADVSADKAYIGLTGSMTEVWKIFTPERKGQQILLEGSLDKIATDLCEALKEDKLI